MTTYIIIGNGVAGNAAAEAIRKHDQNGAISIFAREEYPFYYVDRGVKVDDQMRTGREEIYAAGDLIEHRGRFYGLWPAAQEQGRVAGAAMAGQEVSYEGTVPSSTLKVVGIDLFSAGDIDAEEKLTAVAAKDEARNIYRKLVSDGRAVVGAILLGDIRGSGEIAEAIRTRQDMAALKNDLAEKGLEF